ncbi:hypothetical protein Poli38472_006102 [Pythium oligandrum]|uniref:non-specific serine/threonine protein kinase n=1 Tax=Pythium oligandrum TaxID=41045 RepID=A0A8K1CSA0_PYTOL|nr:hypothetical protein Poli38472_006102 [Pythium oligandrum]|eukprot:TMW68634.1 hypothetical protein Poli38472_006102 [Pythium oligandrum]
MNLRQLFVAAENATTECQRPQRNTLTTQCYGACAQAAPICVSYAPVPSNDTLKEGDGTYYYQGCAYTQMSTCVSNVGSNQCELQCLQAQNQANTEWILDVAQPQADRAETSLFLYVDTLSLPSTLKHFKIVGTTELTRKVPMSFANNAFSSGTGLQKITILDLDVGKISSNIFPANLTTLIMQRTLLTQFEPVGTLRLSELRSLDLSENSLASIPPVIFEMKKLSELYLQDNNLTDSHLSSAQLSFLRGLNTFEANMTVTGECQSGYSVYSWDSKSVCYSGSDSSPELESGLVPDDSQKNDSQSSTSTSMAFVIAGIVVAIILAAVAGIFFLKRANLRKKTETQTPLAPTKPKRKPFSKKKSSDLSDPLRGDASPNRKATFREIPAAEVDITHIVTETSVVTVSLGKYHKTKVFVNRLHVSDDPAENCETALNAAPVVSQLRHPQLLSVIGFMWEDVHTMNVVCESMNNGSLEDYLVTAGGRLTWANFKRKAALEIAGCLMYLHGQHQLTYDGLSGKTVFVDSEKGCKLSTLIASLPSGLMKSHVGRATRGFCAPEVLAGESPVLASDMYAFGVLLAQLDTCETATEMIRNTLRQRAGSSSRGISPSTITEEFRPTDSTSSRRSSNMSMLSMFTFTPECPEIIKELASSCLQYDPSMRPSAQYVSAMLQHLG